MVIYMEIIKIDLKAVLPPKEGNPRNSEGAFLKLNDGRIAFAYSRYCGVSFHDDAECDICVIYSNDNGDSWDTENYKILARASEYGVKNVMSVSLARMDDGDIGLFYIVKYNDGTSSYVMRRYKTDFEGFISETVCIPKLPGSYFVINNDRVQRFSNGRWMIPAAHHLVMGISESGYRRCDARASNIFFASDDDGFTWKQCRGVLNMSDGYTHSGLQEPGAVELPSGAIYAYARTDRMYQYEALSPDFGKSWFGPQPSKFTSPCSPLLIKRNPFSGKYYAVWNPIPNYPLRPESNNRAIGGRTPYVIAESENGTDFSEPIIIESDPNNGYCYCGMYFLDEKTMLLSYCSGGRTEEMLSKTVIKKLILK